MSLFIKRKNAETREEQIKQKLRSKEFYSFLSSKELLNIPQQTSYDISCAINELLGRNATKIITKSVFIGNKLVHPNSCVVIEFDGLFYNLTDRKYDLTKGYTGNAVKEDSCVFELSNNFYSIMEKIK